MANVKQPAKRQTREGNAVKKSKEAFVDDPQPEQDESELEEDEPEEEEPLAPPRKESGYPGRGRYARSDNYGRRDTVPAPSKVRLTGLWESKRPGMFSGDLQDIDAAIALLEECKEPGKKASLVMFENDRRGDRDSVFTVYLNAKDDQREHPRGRSYGNRSNYSRIQDNRSYRSPRDDSF